MAQVRIEHLPVREMDPLELAGIEAGEDDTNWLATAVALVVIAAYVVYDKLTTSNSYDCGCGNCGGTWCSCG